MTANVNDDTLKNFTFLCHRINLLIFPPEEALVSFRFENVHEKMQQGMPEVTTMEERLGRVPTARRMGYHPSPAEASQSGEFKPFHRGSEPSLRESLFLPE